MDVKEVLLPGVGLRYEFTSQKGERIGIIARRTGDFEVVVYAANDPDAARPVFCLTDEEADALAQILGAPRIAERFTELTREVPGLEAATSSSRHRARSLTGRSGRPMPAPAPARRSWQSCVAKRWSHRRTRRSCCASATSLS
ncbi:hypothetical protein I551_4085 [Mycobacterium ulcerans str. Harvey]|uniref:Potassium/proton antiporter subunit KhtT-like N-terminal domain-containing protein n=1 Tax=Mycobacterium ulcerans str. Harvey TaxID=1299332 RepID=A0ABP3ADN0_MYCUL|nr:hypothetical protein I551_4085 [Mycobacterium ulcerans str. Harvey]